MVLFCQAGTPQRARLVLLAAELERRLAGVEARLPDAGVAQRRLRARPASAAAVQESASASCTATITAMVVPQKATTTMSTVTTLPIMAMAMIADTVTAPGTALVQ